MISDFDRLFKCFVNGNHYECEDVLPQSLFYYCSGVDVTPIAYLFDRFELFIYVDIMRYGRSDLDSEFKVLCDRIKKLDMKIEKVEDVLINGIFKSKITLVKKNDKYFTLLFVQGDATKAFKEIYDNDKLILPKCICNIKYEMNTSYFLPLERQVDYILGHAYDKDYECVESFNYLGDYNHIGKVKLFKHYI